MILVKASIRPSPIEGLGLFVEEMVDRGRLVAIYTHDETILPEKDYTDLIKAGDELAARTGCRWIGHLCIYNQTRMEDEDYINHSNEPSLLYHCGVFFARRDMKSGEELTVDYKYILAEKEPGFIDKITGQAIQGLTGREAMIQSARELVFLLENNN
ncbi:MAG: SET domain-containing protein-lysine N-methyltransferase [Deltaproteobacteria bacterium]|nr:SET domain-containing protein-lysine N-methyltransferase [Deltaproteobacteria bacterium]